MKTGESPGGALKTWRQQFDDTFSLSRWVPGVMSGLIIGLLEVILAISFAALIFAGPLSQFVANGIGLALAGAALNLAVVGFFTSLPGTVSGSQDVPAAIMAVGAAAIAAAVPAAAGAQATFMTVVAAIALTTTLTGLFFYGLGHFRLGSLVRFLPYPVVGGFLAGTGWLLILGAIGIMVDFHPTLSSLPALFAAEQLFHWLPGAMLALLMLVVLHRNPYPLALPALVLGAVALFYLVVALGDGSVLALSAEGWLLGPFPSGRLWPVVSPADLNQVHWPALAGQAVNVVTICLMSTIALLLNASGLELTTSREMNLNRELRAAGIGNVITGLAGGLVGYQQLSLSALNHKLGINSRVPAVVAAAFCVLVLFLGGSLLSLFPKVVLGGLLFFLGLSFVLEWAVQSWFTLPRTDYAIVLVILLVTAVAGFLEAIAVGVLVAVALFVVNYSRVDVVRDELSGAQIQSRVTWRPAQRQLLHAQSAQLHILRLQGYIFFGTADRLYYQVRRRIEEREPQPRYLILDFQRVTGIDLTALSSFLRIRQSAHDYGATLILTGVAPAVHRQLSGSRVADETVSIFPDLDRACEWCERQLLASLEDEGSQSNQDPLRQELLRVLGGPELVERLLAYFERQEVVAGEYLMRQGEPPDALYLIESGQVTARLEVENGEGARLQTMEGGHVLGELGFFLGTARTASVVADKPGVIYRLSREALDRMCAQHPDLAAAFHQLIIHLLGERVVHLVTALNGLQG